MQLSSAHTWASAHLTNSPFTPHPKAKQQLQCKWLLPSHNFQVRPLITCFPKMPPRQVAHLCPGPPLSTYSIPPARSHPFRSVSGCPWDSTSHPWASHPRVKLPFSITCSAHDQMTSAAAAAASCSSSIPLLGHRVPGRSPPSPSASRPLCWGSGGREPQARGPPNAHLFLLFFLSPGPRRRPDPPALAAPRPPGAPHSPRVGLLRHGADSRGFRCRLWPGPAAAVKRTGGGLARAGSGRRGHGPALAPSHHGRAGTAGGWRGEARLRGGPAPRRPRSLGPGAGRAPLSASLTGGGGGGSAAALNPTWRRRRRRH